MAKKKTNSVEATFENEENKAKETKSDDPKPIPFVKLYRFSTGFDYFLLFIGMVSALATGALQPLNTVLMGDLTDSMVTFAQALLNGTADDKITATFLDDISDFAIKNSLVGAGLLILTYLATETFNYSALRQIFQIRCTYLKKILNQDISWYDVHQTGDFASRMSEDLNKFEDGIGEKVTTFATFQGTFVAALVIAFVKGWELALVCLTSLPACMLAISIVSVISSKLAKKELDAYGTAGAIAEEVLSSIRTVIAFGGQNKEVKRYEDQLVFAKNNNIRKSLISGSGFGLLWFIIYGSYALAFWYGMGLVLDGSYTMGNMVTVFFSVMTGTTNFGIASPFIEAFSAARAAGAKIFQVIDNKPIINSSRGVGEKLDAIHGNIAFKNVQFYYPNRKEVQILQGLDLEIEAGQTVALVGSSGCGKSTCIQLMQRFYDPLEGEIQLDGKNLKDLDLDWLRMNIGVVGQEPVLFDTSIINNIKYGNPKATEDDVKTAAKKANAHEFIKRLPNGYNTIVGERGAQLSGGQKQRIAIARALVRNPSILLLDEATSALDTNSEAKVQAAIDSASKECTTIIVAHRLSTIRGADKIVVISKGKVVQQGTHDELMALQTDYFNLVTAQVQNKDEIEESSRANDKNIDFEDERKDSIIDTSAILEAKDDAEQSNKASFLTILKMNQPEWLDIIIGCLGAIGIGCSMPVFAIIFGNLLGIFNELKTDDQIRDETNTYALYFTIAGVVSGIAQFCKIYMFSRAGEKLTMRVRGQSFAAMLRQEMGYFDLKDNGVGALCSRLSSEAAYIQGAAGERIGTILQSIATLIFSITVSVYYEWRLGLVALAFTPVILVATFFQNRFSSGADDSRNKSIQDSAKIAVEAVISVRTVASLGCEEQFQNLYVQELLPHQRRTLISTHFRSLVYGLGRSIMFFAYAACIYYGGQLVKDGLDYSIVFKVTQALIMGSVSIANALAIAPNFQKGLSAADKIIKLFNRIPKIRDDGNVKEQNWEQGNIKYDTIQFSYPTRSTITVLKGLNLEVLQGKTVALVGPSGCGKSTIVQLIERFYDPTSGEVSMNGENIKSITLTSLRSHLGIVSQEPNLFNRTIAENIAYGDNSREVPMADIIEAAKNANIHNYISALPSGYDTKLGEKGTQLSGGEKQRVAIARALVRNPKVLLLDEATSALDTESEKIVQDALDNAKKGRTCITIAHRLSTIHDADLICVIDKGIVAEMGTHSELLMKGGLYYKLHSLQNK